MRFGPQQRNQLHYKRLYKQNHNVMKRKTFYEAPETELILVKFEENIMSPVPGGAGDDEPIVEGPDFE